MNRLATLLFGIAFLSGCNQKVVTEITCGGAINTICPSDMYCELGPNCGGFDREGICRKRPLQCSGPDDLVCGCDGKSYSSPCYAAAVGITVASKGGCQKPDAEEEEGHSEEGEGEPSGE